MNRDEDSAIEDQNEHSSPTSLQPTNPRRAKNYSLLLGLALVGFCLPLFLTSARQDRFPSDFVEARLYALAWKFTPDFLLSALSRSKNRNLSEKERLTLSRIPNHYDEIITLAAFRNQLDPNLLKAVIYVESRFQPHSVSPKGALGLMQLMPATAQEIGVRDPKDPHENIAGGAKYLRMMLDRFDSRLELALAAYNAGPGTVARYRAIPPYRETVNYVEKVLQYYSLFRSSAHQSSV